MPTCLPTCQSVSFILHVSVCLSMPDCLSPCLLACLSFSLSFFLSVSTLSLVQLLHTSLSCFISIPLPLDVVGVVHFLVFLRSFRFKSFLSQFSPFVAQIKDFCSDPGFFLLTMFAKDLTGCFNYCCVECGDHSIHVCVFIVHDGKRCKLPTYHSLEGFQNIGIFQLFEVKLASCVLWLADSFQAKVEGHHRQVMAASSVCSWKTSCSGNVHF